MTPLKILKLAVSVLEKSPVQYCLVGGHAASLYRSQARLTRDVDFALVSGTPSGSRAAAEKVITEIGLKPVVGLISRGAHEVSRRPVCMITSAPAKGELAGMIDILLPELPWVPLAVERAQYNKIDLGFSKVPVITPEDLVVAKCYSLKNEPDRFQDLDDLKEIFLGVSPIDYDYVRSNLARLKLSLPEVIRKYAPSL